MLRMTGGLKYAEGRGLTTEYIVRAEMLTTRLRGKRFAQGLVWFGATAGSFAVPTVRVVRCDNSEPVGENSACDFRFVGQRSWTGESRHSIKSLHVNAGTARHRNIRCPPRTEIVL